MLEFYNIVEIWLMTHFNITISEIGFYSFICLTPIAGYYYNKFIHHLDEYEKYMKKYEDNIK